MTRSFLDDALRERDRLQSELEASVTYRRLQMVEGLIAAYRDEDSLKGVSRKSRASSSRPATGSRALPANKVQDIIGHAMECIQREGGAASKRAIHEYVLMKGIEVSDAALSGYLSKSFQLRYDTAKGWMLEDPESLKLGLRRADVVPLRESGAAEPRSISETATAEKEESAGGMRQSQALWASEGGF